MGIKQIVTDDLTGDTLEDVEPTLIEMDGAKYDVYLSPTSKETLTALFNGEAPILAKVKRAAVAEPDTADKKTEPKTGGTGRKTVETYGYDFADVRAWAIANGQKGKSGSPITENTKVIYQGIWDAYRDAQG